MQPDLISSDVGAKAVAAWCPPGRALVALAGTPLVELTLPEYSAAGLGRVLCRTRPFRIRDDEGQTGTFARSICADTSRLLVVTAEMEPTVLGQSHDEIQARAPREALKHLFDAGLPIELVTLGATRAEQFETLDLLAEFVRLYHRQASWLEGHPLDVAIARLELESRPGASLVFEGTRLFCEGAGK
ncbi:hypothetical protein [Castellaniella sp.]|uniref:hypothetical protein n=1 Tax=Castellaniella sp. TaxID=1955812 RepID=UPI002AFFFD03|nr:hypothetical protein [Castellaniella sp.]